MEPSGSGSGLLYLGTISDGLLYLGTTSDGLLYLETISDGLKEKTPSEETYDFPPTYAF
jgi:hypothetical protein